MTRILVADNDPDALDLLLLDLRLEGYVVHGSTDGNSALRDIETFRPDAVVLDHRMAPGPSGLTVGLKLRAELPDLPVLIYSNYQDVDLVRRATDNGIRFIPKGNLRTLRTALDTAIASMHELGR